jgi:S-formylglutathione hydrolase FrmB
MRRSACWLTLLLALPASAPAVQAHPVRNTINYWRVSGQLHGELVNYTRTGLGDRRIWSPALQARRDLFVYLPPCYDPRQQYPLMLWLHGFAEDEGVFLRSVISRLDEAIWTGRLPPVVIAAPDGSLRGFDCYLAPGSFFLNTRAGPFEDYLINDIYGFVMSHYSIRPEPEAHVVLGVSAGGGAAFNKVFKYPHLFRTAVGVFPPLNTRWQDCHGDHRANFDPCCWGWRTDFERRRAVEGIFFGVVPIRLGRIINRVYPRGEPQNTLEAISRENPIEMLSTYDVQPGQLNLYAAYGGRDEFNIDAQVESFLWVARQRGIEVGVGYLPDGRHNMATAVKLLPGILDFLAPVLLPYSPPLHRGCNP